MHSLWLNDQVDGEHYKHPVIGAENAPTRFTYGPLELLDFLRAAPYNAGTDERRGLKKDEGQVMSVRRPGEALSPSRMRCACKSFRYFPRSRFQK
jgi:hypothetical protein